MNTWRAQQERLRRIRQGQAPVRLCRRCQRPASSARSWYCDRCRAIAQEKHRRSSAERFHPQSRKERGYGSRHIALRKMWAKRVDAGGVVCGYCGRPILPGQSWDLSHPGDDKRRDPVPWHSSENRRYAATVTKRRRRVQ